MKPNFQVPLKGRVFPSNGSQLSSSQRSTSSKIPTNSQLSTPGLTVKQLKLPVFSRKRKLLHGNTKKIQRRDEDSLEFSQQGVFLQRQDDNSLERDTTSSSSGSKNLKKKKKTILEAQSIKSKKITKSKRDNIHHNVTNTLVAAAVAVTPKRKRYLITKERNKYSFKKTPERQQKSFNSGSHLTLEKTSVLTNSADKGNADTVCRTPTKNIILKPTTPPSRRKLLSKQQYFLGVGVEKQNDVSSVYEENVNGVMSKTANDQSAQRNGRNVRSASLKLMYNFPISPSNDESTVTTKRDKQELQKRLRNRQVLTLIYKMADQIQELRRRQRKLLIRGRQTQRLTSFKHRWDTQRI